MHVELAKPNASYVSQLNIVLIFRRNNSANGWGTISTIRHILSLQGTRI